jgi:hypothetical protein
VAAGRLIEAVSELRKSYSALQDALAALANLSLEVSGAV